MINYPYKKNDDMLTSKEDNHINYANRGMDFERAVNLSNNYYKDNDMALIYKRPTPIHIAKVDYTNIRIKDAYFEKKSTTDYNGVYKGKYIDFECKETKSKTSLSLNNISLHQINHLEKVNLHGGIAFFLIYFSTLNEVYLLDAKYIIDISHKNEKKSISYSFIKQYGIEVKQGYIPRLEYLDAIEKVYFNEESKALSK